MNERIRELLSQAGVHYEVMPKDTVYEKFAELIVQECLDLLWNSLTISADHVGVVDGIEYTGKEILIAAKEHFGVTE